MFDWKTRTLTIFIGNPKDNHVYMTMPFYRCLFNKQVHLQCSMGVITSEITATT